MMTPQIMYPVLSVSNGLSLRYPGSIYNSGDGTEMDKNNY